jgi:hypothetical protein
LERVFEALFRLYKHDQELDDYGTNDLPLRRVYQLTGARFNPDPRDIFDPHGRTATWKIDLWPAMAAAAIMFVLVEWTSIRRRQLVDIFNF